MSNKRVHIDELSDSSSSDDEADNIWIAEHAFVDKKSTSWQLIGVIDLTSLGPLPTQVMLRMENNYNELKVRALGCNIRDGLTKKLWEEGSADQVINHNRR